MPIRICTWNVNSAKSRLQHLLELLKSEHAPDILLLQEIKCITENFPFMEVEECGFQVAAHGQKTYNGVAIISRHQMEDIITELPGDEDDIQARYIEAVINLPSEALRVCSVYVPNGKSPDHADFSYKLRFIERLKEHAQTLLSYNEKLIIGGDYNVAPNLEADCYNSKALNGSICCHPDERNAFNALCGIGLYDAYRLTDPHGEEFSWWDYRGGSWQQNKGLRIDHLLLSAEAADSVESVTIDLDTRGKEKPSDHAPVIASFRT